MLKYAQIAKGLVRGTLLGEPYRLNVSLTNMCNSRCKTCDVWKVYPERRLDAREELRTEEFRSIFRKLPRSVMWISFSGGEPNLRKDFVSIIEACFCEVASIALINVPTNAIQSERCVENWHQLLAIRSRPFVHISVSIDGPRVVHDNVRGVPGNHDSAMKTVSELHELVQRFGNAQVGVGLTVSRHNFEHVLPFARELLARKIPLKVEAAYAGELYYPRAKGALPNLQAEGVRETMRELHLLLRKHQWRILSPRDYLERSHARGTLRFAADPSRLVIPCRAGRSSYAFDCYGNVNPCFFFSPGLGNVRDYDYDLMSLLRANHDRLTAARAAIDAERCPRCWLVCNSLESMIDRKLRAPWRSAVPRP